MSRLLTEYSEVLANPDQKKPVYTSSSSHLPQLQPGSLHLRYENLLTLRALAGRPAQSCHKVLLKKTRLGTSD